MTAPYNMAAVEAIRAAIAQSTPPQFIREKLGWDVTMFERVCRRHGIEIAIAHVRPPAAALQGSAVDNEPIIPRPPSLLQTARTQTRVITRAHRMVWRSAIISRRAWRSADQQAKNYGLSFAESLSRIVERAISDGSACEVYILQRGDIRRDITCNVRLMPGIDQRLDDIAAERKCKPTQLIASILEAKFRDIVIGS
jgi:hypothetical protein